MKLGSLFSGAGLGDLGWMMAGFDIRWQVEIDKYCQKILQLRFPESKKYHDIKTIKGKDLEPVDIVAGGVPCQAASVAGKQRGREDDRWLWPQAIRIIEEVKPHWVVWENVFGLLSLERGVPFEDICSEMESCGYEVQTFSFTAHSLGASHRRERIWIVGYSHNARSRTSCSGIDENRKNEDVADSFSPISRGGREDQQFSDKRRESRQTRGESLRSENRKTQTSEFEYGCENVANTDKKRSQGGRANKYKKRWKGQDKRQTGLCSLFKEWWSTEPSIRRVVNGCPNRIHRLKALGNGQVVACTAFIGSLILDFERMRKNDKKS